MLQRFWEKIEDLHQRKIPFVVYRKPNKNKLVSMAQQSRDIHYVRDFTETGFVFAPFDGKKQAILIRPDELHRVVYPPKENKGPGPKGLPIVAQDQKTFHINLVTKGIAEIDLGTLKKVVLSRKTEHPCTENPIQLFQKLLDTYFSAFCYLWYHPRIGLWLGATPELLLKANGTGFTTVSLAGTQKYEGKPPIWKKKELEEQSLVTNYISEALATKIKEFEISELESIKAGNLWHLRTSISGRTGTIQIGELIKILHPTPAVCGIPRVAAKEFILKNENYDREYYTGFLGMLNFKDSESITELFVNLRCMQVRDEKGIIYVGGGITQESIPESEWQETIDKSSTMLNILLNRD